MKLVSGLVLLMVAAASEAASGGVGVWTLLPGSSGTEAVVVDPGGAVYENCGIGAGICKSVNHGLTWQTLNGPPSFCLVCSTSVLAVDSSETIYAAEYGGGGGNLYSLLYASRDAGATWTMLIPEMLGTNHLSLTIDPSISGNLFLLRGIGFLNGFLGGTLGRSTDGGAHWTDESPAGYSSVTAFALDLQSSGRLYAAVAEVDFFRGVATLPALQVSSDGGSTWTSAARSLPNVFTTLVVDPFHSATIIGGGPSGIFRSTDGGQTFSTQSTAAVVQIVADPVHSGRFYAAIPPNGVLTSSDGGATWAAMNTGLTDLGVNALALDPSAGYLYAATNSGVFVDLTPGPGLLILDAAHPFMVTLSATDPHSGATAPGVATQVNDLWGYFSIPAITNNANNPEVFVKLLDATAVNGEFWFFYGGLTSLEYTLTVTDSTTGAQKTYTKAAGSECGGSDTAAFTP
jgi:photosystem II stability/assembly factor-like uncharacterized protein